MSLPQFNSYHPLCFQSHHLLSPLSLTHSSFCVIRAGCCLFWIELLFILGTINVSVCIYNIKDSTVFLFVFTDPHHTFSFSMTLHFQFKDWLCRVTKYTGCWSEVFFMKKAKITVSVYHVMIVVRVCHTGRLFIQHTSPHSCFMLWDHAVTFTGDRGAADCAAWPYGVGRGEHWARVKLEGKKDIM